MKERKRCQNCLSENNSDPIFRCDPIFRFDFHPIFTPYRPDPNLSGDFLTRIIAGEIKPVGSLGRHGHAVFARVAPIC